MQAVAVGGACCWRDIMCPGLRSCSGDSATVPAWCLSQLLCMPPSYLPAGEEPQPAGGRALARQGGRCGPGWLFSCCCHWAAALSTPPHPRPAPPRPDFNLSEILRHQQPAPTIEEGGATNPVRPGGWLGTESCAQRHPEARILPLLRRSHSAVCSCRIWHLYPHALQMWLAPEVLRGERATASADVYAFGLVRALRLLLW